jgi:hypothetical protein
MSKEAIQESEENLHVLIIIFRESHGECKKIKKLKNQIGKIQLLVECLKH